MSKTMKFKMTIKRISAGLTEEEYERARRYVKDITSRIDANNPNYSALEREAQLGVVRDIQAQRLPPNIRIPSRRKPLDYLRTVHRHVGSLPLSIRSYLSPGSWTSSGGSFKLAEEAGYDICKIMLDIAQQNANATLLEIGAGYAGFKSEQPAGIKKLAMTAGDKLGKTVYVHFTNLTRWHRQLPDGIVEHHGFVARDIEFLANDGVTAADIIYSQCAAYFEPELGKFVTGASRLLKPNGYLIFNAPTMQHNTLVGMAYHLGLKLEKSLELGGENGNLYVFRK